MIRVRRDLSLRSRQMTSSRYDWQQDGSIRSEERGAKTDTTSAKFRSVLVDRENGDLMVPKGEIPIMLINVVDGFLSGKRWKALATWTKPVGW